MTEEAEAEIELVKLCEQERHDTSFAEQEHLVWN